MWREEAETLARYELSVYFIKDSRNFDMLQLIITLAAHIYYVAATVSHIY